ncbi:MAG: hypothetical protein WC998_01790 [Candidatus Paceibacterota bacterium]|jgi:hypothetical protein
MKKQYIIILILVLILIAAGSAFYFSKGLGNNQRGGFQFMGSEIDASSLEVGKIATVMGEEKDGTIVAERVIICSDEENCFNPKQGREQPDGNIPEGENRARPNNDMGDKAFLSGTISEKNDNSLVLTLDTGETATVAISESTKIFQND